ncbi:MAG: nucleotidyltransferase family protein [Epsilonproteobacteria bacterium]|nr:nucleotidyltransferase family protein [Campylobacterota bacterium]
MNRSYVKCKDTTPEYKLRKIMPLLQSKYNVATLEIFGSYARGEADGDSDLDLLVSFKEPPTLLKFIELENFLSDTLQIKVDLVMKSALKHRIGRKILSETQVI